MEYFIDKTNTRTLEDVLTSEEEWRPIRGDIANFGYSKYTYWFRLKMDVLLESNDSYFFELKYKFIDHIEFYRPVKNGTYEKILSGNNTPFSKRRYLYRLAENRSRVGDLYYVRTSSMRADLRPVVPFPLN